MLKKGAMFGLDARIALAIFGALSVISGAALYSAIQDSKATALYTDLIETAKAYEAYMLDTGTHLPVSGDFTLDAHYLVEDNSVAGWQGPYLPYKTANVRDLSYKNSIIIYFGRTTSSLDWGDSTSHGSPACNLGDDCNVWSCFVGLEESEVKLVLKKVKGTEDYRGGKLRYYVPAKELCLMVMPSYR